MRLAAQRGHAARIRHTQLPACLGAATTSRPFSATEHGPVGSSQYNWHDGQQQQRSHAPQSAPYAVSRRFCWAPAPEPRPSIVQRGASHGWVARRVKQVGWYAAVQCWHPGSTGDYLAASSVSVTDGKATALGPHQQCYGLRPKFGTATVQLRFFMCVHRKGGVERSVLLPVSLLCALRAVCCRSLVLSQACKTHIHLSQRRCAPPCVLSDCLPPTWVRLRFPTLWYCAPWPNTR